MKMNHPKTTQLEDWPEGWLKFKCASLLKNPQFLAMYDHEKKESGLPITKDEMIKFIKDNA